MKSKIFKTKCGKYKIFNNGKVYSFQTKKLLIPNRSKAGLYEYFRIADKNIRIDKLALQFFKKEELDNDFVTGLEIRKTCRCKRIKNKELHKKQLIEWIELNGRLPSQHSINIEEKRCNRDMRNYCNYTKTGSYDVELHQWLVEKYGMEIKIKNKHNPEGRKEELLNWIKEHKRCPSLIIPEEVRLAGIMSDYTSPNSSLRDDSLIEKIKEIDKCWHTQIAKKFRKSINEALGDKPLTEENMKEIQPLIKEEICSLN
jgi:hypothetical protein